MKTKTILATLLVTAFTGLAFAQNSSLTTTDGKTYTHISDVRADPDGLYLEYTTPGGGLGGAKVKFTKLSLDLQKQYGYNADAAKQYESDSAKGTLAFMTWASQRDEARQKAASDRDARALQEETLATQRLIAAAKLAQASQSAPPQPAYQPVWSYYGPGFGIGLRAPRNAFTGETYQGSVPYANLFTPLGYSPNKIQVIPAAPNRAFTAPRSHQEPSRNF